MVGSKHKRSKGFSLVELMISLALGSLVTVGVIQLFVANQESYNLLQGQSRMQESARFAFDFIGRSVRKAGYRGCFSHPAGLYMGVINSVPYSFDLRQGIQAYNDGAGIAELPTSTSVADSNLYIPGSGKEEGNGIDTASIVAGTDVLVVRNIVQEDMRLSQQLDEGTEPIPVKTPTAGFPLTVDDLAVIHDCEKATVFRITGLSETGGITTIAHGTGDTDIFKNNELDLALVNTFEADAAVSAIESDIFYIAPGEGVNNYGNAPLSLWRKTGINAPVELIEGVEDMQLLFGVDTDEDETPNQYVPANLVGNDEDWETVETVRVSLVVNSVDDVGSTSIPTQGCAIQGCITGEAYDGLIRRAFTQTFQLRN